MRAAHQRLGSGSRPASVSGLRRSETQRRRATEAGWLITGDIGYLTKDERLVLDRPRQGSDRAQRTQHRSGGDRRRRQRFSRRANQFGGRHAGSICRRGANSFRGARARTRASICAASHIAPRTQHHGAAGEAQARRRPRALPVTAVGKIFKPTLRDLAIKEKAKLEIERVFGEGSERRDRCRQRRKAEYARSHRCRHERQYAPSRTSGKPRIRCRRAYLVEGRPRNRAQR